MNKLIEKYIRDNKIDMKCFKVSIICPFLVELVDVNNDKLSIMNMSEDIIIYINDTEYGTYYFNDTYNLWLTRKVIR